jgi:hypothetical protein
MDERVKRAATWITLVSVPLLLLWGIYGDPRGRKGTLLGEKKELPNYGVTFDVPKGCTIKVHVRRTQAGDPTRGELQISTPDGEFVRLGSEPDEQWESKPSPTGKTCIELDFKSEYGLCPLRSYGPDGKGLMLRFEMPHDWGFGVIIVEPVGFPVK